MLGDQMNMEVLAGGVRRVFQSVRVASGQNRDCYQGAVHGAEWVGPLVVKIGTSSALYNSSMREVAAIRKGFRGGWPWPVLRRRPFRIGLRGLMSARL